MPPLTLGTAVHDVPEDFPDLLNLLAARPQPAVVWYGRPQAGSGEPAPERVELSGRVLQNWAVKLIGLFTEELTEVFEGPGAQVLLDTAPHWKSAAVALAAGALDATVHVMSLEDQAAGPSGPKDLSPQPPSLVVTDRPETWTGGELAGALGDAELAAISPGLLDASFEEAIGRPIQAWVLDVSAEVRQHPDQLLSPLEPVSLPGPVEPVPGAVVAPSGARPPQLETWRGLNWAGDVTGQILGVWARSGTVVLVDADPVSAPEPWDAMFRNESPS